MTALARTAGERDRLLSEEVAPAPTPNKFGGKAALARTASGSFALQVTNTAAAVVTTIILARLMEVSAFGTYSWVVATVYLLTVPAVLGADRLLVRDVSVYLDSGAAGHVRGLLRRAVQLVLVTCSVIVTVIAVAVLILDPGTDPQTEPALLIGLLALPALSLGFIFQSALMGMHKVVVGQFSELLLRPALLVALVLLGAAFLGAPISAPMAVGFFTASAVISAAIAFVVLRRRMRTTINPAAPAYESRRWLAAAVGLVFLSGALFINSQIGVVLLGVLDQHDSAGIYAVAQRGAMLVVFPLLALNAAIAPTAARLWAAGDVRQLQRLVTMGARGALLVSVPIAIAFILAGDVLVKLIFGPAFAAAALPMAILSAGQIANAATGSVTTLLIMTGNERRAAFGIAAGLALNVGLGLLLIPSYQATGAAVAAASGMIVANLIHVVVARSSLRIDSTVLGLPPRLRS
jgi:O-antigen/teichoic acid export membrane protein